MANESPEELYKQLKLFTGAIGEFAQVMGVEYESVRKAVRDNKWDNTRYIDAAKQVLKRRKEEVMARVADY